MSELEDEVERVEPLFQDVGGYTIWWAVKLKARPEVFALHNNWVGLYGPLKPGDRVRYAVSKAQLNQGPLFDKLTRISEEKGDWEAKPEL